MLFCLLVTACGGSISTKPTQNAERYTEDGLTAFSEANWSRAQSSFFKALTFYQGLDDQPGILASHINLAEVALINNDNYSVEKHLLVASDIAERTAQTDIQARINLLYAQNAVQQNQLAVAKKRLQLLLPEFNGPNPVGSVSQLQLIAIAVRTKVAFAEHSDASLWTQRFANTLRLSGSKDLALKARLLRFQASLLQQQREFASAEANLQRALGYYKDTHSRSGIALTLSELGQLYALQDRWQDARAYTQRAITVFGYLHNAEKVAELNKDLVGIDLQLENLVQGE